MKIKITKVFLYAVLVLFCQQLSAAIFTAEDLSSTAKRRLIENAVWYMGCPVPLNRLSWLTVSYYDFAGHEKIGHLIAFDATAPSLLTAFRKMYEMHYPLESVGSPAPNSYEETTDYTCRAIRGENTFSMHAYGMAIDINVTRNPYIGIFKLNEQGLMMGQLIPPILVSYSYLNRSVQRPGMNEEIVSLMAKSGFIVWGGQWQDRVDYQHFQLPDNIAKNLAYLDRASGEQLMRLVAQYPQSALKMSDDRKWQYLYQLYPKQFAQVLAQFFPLLSHEDEDKVFNLVYQKLSATI